MSPTRNKSRQIPTTSVANTAYSYDANVKGNNIRMDEAQKYCDKKFENTSEEIKMIMPYPESPAKNGPFKSSLSWNDLTCGKEQETSETDIELRQRSSSICVFGFFDVNEQNAEINLKDSPKQSNFAEKYDTIYLDFDKCCSKKMKKGNYVVTRTDFIH